MKLVSIAVSHLFAITSSLKKLSMNLRGGEFYTKSVKRSGTNGGRPGTL